MYRRVNRIAFYYMSATRSGTVYKEMDGRGRQQGTSDVDSLGICESLSDMMKSFIEEARKREGGVGKGMTTVGRRARSGATTVGRRAGSGATTVGRRARSGTKALGRREKQLGNEDGGRTTKAG